MEQAIFDKSVDVIREPIKTEQTRDAQDLQRAIIAYRFWYPTVSAEGIFQGNRDAGLKDGEAIPILSAQPHHVGFTLNSDTPYGGGPLDLSDGPIVVEMPPGPYIGLVDDRHQRWVVDMGIPGPDAGKGGKYLIVPPDYEGEIPEGYYVCHCPSLMALFAVRALPIEGDVDGALESMHAIKVYPLSSKGLPKLLRFVDVTSKPVDMSLLRWEDNLDFWKVLSRIIEEESVIDEFRPMYGILASLGMERGKPFAPNRRMSDILTEAAVEGRKQMLMSAFASTRPDRMAWRDRYWEWVGLVSDNGNFETPNFLDMEAKDRWFAQAIVGSPAMFRRKEGQGSLYWLGLRESDGSYLDGSKTYRLNVPLPVPASLFWSVTVYDTITRSEIQTDQNKAALRSLFELKDVDGSKMVDLYFGPQPPAKKEHLWIQTVPGREWFCYFRIYGPKQAAFDESWKPGDFEEVK
ncbi:MAG TPA: DUF1254 domain-containing protein [Bdellovibrionales bacterium]|nr:DUF1254 domain-containing protein [Bdellovibrionales bacterium]